MTQPNQPKKTDQVKEEAQNLTDNAKLQAEDLKASAADATQQVVDQAKVEASQVAGEARDQVRGLLDATLGEVRDRTSEGQQAVATSLLGLTDELQKMARGERTEGPVAQVANQLVERGQGFANWLADSEPEAILLEVRRFAARRPSTFLAIAAGAGLLAGRMARGQRELVAEEQRREEARRRLAQQPYGYTQPGHVETGYVHTEQVQPGYAQPGYGYTYQQAPTGTQPQRPLNHVDEDLTRRGVVGEARTTREDGLR